MTDSSPELIDVRHGDMSVRVAPEFYGVALGILTIGIDVVDVFRDGDVVSIVFLESQDLEAFSEFLLIHDLFPGPDGLPVIHGSFMMTLEEDEEVGPYCSPTYFMDVPPEHLARLEVCLVAHTPVSSAAPS